MNSEVVFLLPWRGGSMKNMMINLKLFENSLRAIDGHLIKAPKFGITEDHKYIRSGKII